MLTFSINPKLVWVCTVFILTYASSSEDTWINKRLRSEEVSRYSRSSGDIIDNLQRLSRIASGIALEIGLQDNSLSPDDAIAELLHLGALKLEDVLNLDKTAIDSALETLKRLPNPEDEVKQVENRLIVLDDVRRISEFMLGFGNFSGKEEYRKGLDEVEKLSAIDVSGFQTLKADIIALNGVLMRYNFYPDELTDQQLTDLEAFLQADPIHLRKLENSVKVLDPIIPQIKEAKKLLEHADFLDILYKERNIRAQFNEGYIYSESLEDIIENIKTVKKAQENLITLKAPFETLRSLVDTRTSSFQPMFEFTSGLPKGSLDLDFINIDTGSTWIMGRVGDSKVVIKGLDKAFDPYRDLTAKLKDVEKLWSLNLQENELVKILEAFSSVLSLGDDLQPAFDAMKQLKDCDEYRSGMDDSNYASKFDLIRVKIDFLNLKVANLSNFDYIEKLKDLSTLKQALNTTEKIDKAVATKVVSDLKSEPLFESTLKSLTRLMSDLEFLETIEEISDLATNISLGFRDIENYHEIVKRVNVAFFEKLHKVDSNRSSNAREAVAALQKTHLTLEIISTASAAIDRILESRNLLKKAQASAENLKRVDDTFKKSFKDYQVVSYNLGIGVQGLLAIRTAYEAKKDLAPLLENVDSIIQSSTELAQVHKDSLKKLNDLVNTFNRIDQFQKKLAGYQALRKKRNANFKSVENIFDDAALIPEFKEDFRLLEKSLIVLNHTSVDVESIIEKLATLDLEFVQYNFGEAKNSLEAMDNFFLEYAKQLKTLPSSNIVTSSPESLSKKVKTPEDSPSHWGRFSSTTSTTTASSVDEILIFFTTPAGIVLLHVIIIISAILVLVAIFCCSCSCCQKKKTEASVEVVESKRDVPIDKIQERIITMSRLRTIITSMSDTIFTEFEGCHTVGSVGGKGGMEGFEIETRIAHSKNDDKIERESEIVLELQKNVDSCENKVLKRELVEEKKVEEKNVEIPKAEVEEDHNKEENSKKSKESGKKDNNRSKMRGFKKVGSKNKDCEDVSKNTESKITESENKGSD